MRSTPEQQACAQIDRLLAAVGGQVCAVLDVNIPRAHRVVMTAILLVAAQLNSLVLADAPSSSLEPWLERFAALEKSVWQQSPPEATALDAAQNARNLLRSLHLLLVLPKPDPTPDQRVAREQVVVTLQQIRR